MANENEIRNERVRAVAQGVRAGVSDKLSSIWWSFLLRGIFAVALGVFAFFWPDLNVGLLVLAVGLYCLADGATGLFGALRHPELRENLLQSLIVGGIGAILIFWPGATLRTLLVLLGAAALVVGIGQLLTARRLAADDPQRGATLSAGGAVAIVGLVLVFWPGSGVAVVSWVIGIAALLIGALLVYLGSMARRMQKRIGSPTSD